MRNLEFSSEREDDPQQRVALAMESNGKTKEIVENSGVSFPGVEYTIKRTIDFISNHSKDFTGTDRIIADQTLKRLEEMQATLQTLHRQVIDKEVRRDGGLVVLTTEETREINNRATALSRECQNLFDSFDARYRSN
ncbi:hypothetical protein HYV70_03405 [Candidatus Uhrbacteria bacterium]|nr:hypothetical protein [Candidatus Uhrbacteria bacterium]